MNPFWLSHIFQKGWWNNHITRKPISNQQGLGTVLDAGNLGGERHENQKIAGWCGLELGWVVGSVGKMSEITMFQQKLCKNQGHNWNINMSNMIYIYTVCTYLRDHFYKNQGAAQKNHQLHCKHRESQLREFFVSRKWGFTGFTSWKKTFQKQHQTLGKNDIKPCRLNLFQCSRHRES